MSGTAYKRETGTGREAGSRNFAPKAPVDIDSPSAAFLRQQYLFRERERANPLNVLKRQRVEKHLRSPNSLIVNPAVVILGNLAYEESARPLFELLASRRSAGIEMSILSAIKQIANDHAGKPELEFGVKKLECFIRKNLADSTLVSAAVQILRHIGRTEKVLATLEGLESDAANHPESRQIIQKMIMETLHRD